MAAVTPSGSVQKLDFGRHYCFCRKTPRAERPPQLGVFPVISDNFRDKLHEASLELMRHDRKIDEGPYADRFSSVEWLVDEMHGLAADVAGGKPSKEQMMRCVMDVIRPWRSPSFESYHPRAHVSEKHRFVLNEDANLYITEPVSAGSILSDMERHVMASTREEPFILFANAMEPFFIATSVLRRLGFQAYPALASATRMDGTIVQSPVMAVVEPADEAPLQTFPLLRGHPCMDSILLIGDDAMEGVAWAVLAQKRVKDLAVEIVGEDAMHPPSSIHTQLVTVAETLVQCHASWPQSPFIDDVLAYMKGKVTEALDVIGAAALGAGTIPHVSGERYSFMIPEKVLEFVHPVAEARAGDYVQAVKEKMLRIARGN